MPCDELACLVGKGKKRATCSAYFWIESGEEKLPEVGQTSVVVNSNEEAVCIIRTTKVYITEFCNVSEAHAALEGEGDLSLAYWRTVHREFFTRDLASAGIAFDDHTKLICEEFEKVYPG